jgi:hypothetical protein
MSEDVKNEETIENTEESSTEVEESGIESELAKMFETEDSGKIPYSRFKEVNDKYKASEAKVKEMQANIDAQIAQAVKQAKLDALVEGKSQQVDEIEEFTFEDTSSKQIKELEQMLAKQNEVINNLTQKYEYDKVTSQITQLKKSFPHMDEDTVLAYKQKRPDLPLEELAKYDHDRRTKMVAAAVEKMLDEKKKAAKEVKIIGREQMRASQEGKKPRESLLETEEAIRKIFGD